MDGVENQAALAHHVGGHGAVDAAGEQHTRPAGRTDRQTAGAFLLVAVHKHGVAHLDRYGELRVMHVHLQMGVMGKQKTADFGADLGRSFLKLFVAAFGVDLEGAHVCKIVAEKLQRRLPDGVHVLVAHGGHGKADDAEHTAHELHGAVEVDVVALGRGNDGRLRFDEFEFAERRKPPAHVFD